MGMMYIFTGQGTCMDRLQLMPTSGKDPKIQHLIEDSIKNDFLGEIVRDRLNHQVVVFVYDGAYAGYAIPRQEGAYWRVGPIYVDPKYQGKGIAKTFIQGFFATRKGRAYIDPKNLASGKAFIDSGFKKTGKVMRGSRGDLLEQYEWTPPSKTLGW